MGVLSKQKNIKFNRINHAYPVGTPTPDGLVDAA